jgi:hypothetical protein
MLPTISRLVLPPTILFVGLLLYRVCGVQPVPDDLVPSKNVPWVVTPEHNEPRIATDEQLHAVLQRMLPTAEPVNTNTFVHALRLWGVEAEFNDPKVLSGKQLREYFLNDQYFQQLAGAEAPPVFVSGSDGVRARDFDENYPQRFTSSYHNDDLLATFAETGTPLDTPLMMRDRQTTVGQLLTDSMRRFHPARHEFEWSVISYLRYLYPHKEWRNKYGDKLDIAKMTQMCTGRMGQGPCRGQHRFEALVLLIRIDDQAHALSPKTRQAILAYMKAASERLVAAQAPDGSWSARWIEGAAAKASADDSNAEKKIPLHEKLLVTGHTLEWLALAPEEVQPPRETIVRAGQWLCNTIVGIDQKDLATSYGPYSHAARALCLWRGKEAFPMWQQITADATKTDQASPAQPKE